MTTVGVQFLCTKHIVSIVNSHHFCVFTTKNSGKVPLNKVVYDLHRSLTMGSRNQGFGANLEQIIKNRHPRYLECRF